MQELLYAKHSLSPASSNLTWRTKTALFYTLILLSKIANQSGLRLLGPFPENWQHGLVRERSKKNYICLKQILICLSIKRDFWISKVHFLSIFFQPRTMYYTSNKSLLRRIRFFFFQLWRLVTLEPLGVQGRNLPRFKGLIDANWKSSSSRVWQQYYYLSRPLEKGHFTPKMAKGITFILGNCIHWNHNYDKVTSRTAEWYPW